MNPTLEKEIRDQLAHLSDGEQRRVLNFARALVGAPSVLEGVPGSNLLRFAGTIEAEDLGAMTQAIKEGCEAVVPDDW